MSGISFTVAIFIFTLKPPLALVFNVIFFIITFYNIVYILYFYVRVKVLNIKKENK